MTPLFSTRDTTTIYNIEWWHEAPRRRKIFTRYGLRTCDFPPIVFGIVQLSGRTRALLACGTSCNEPTLSSMDCVITTPWHVCLGLYAADMVFRGEMDAVTAFWMSEFRQDDPHILLSPRMFHDWGTLGPADKSCFYVHKQFLTDAPVPKLTY